MYKYSVSVRALYSKFTARAPPTQGSFSCRLKCPKQQRGWGIGKKRNRAGIDKSARLPYNNSEERTTHTVSSSS